MSETLGQAILRGRCERELSLQKLADAAWITKAHAWDLETGRSTNPTAKTIIRLSAALGIPLHDMIDAAAETYQQERLLTGKP